jgi:hypothetical protein
MASLVAPTATIIFAAAALGLFAGPIAAMMVSAADGLLDPAAYIAAVMGGGA